MRFYSLTMASAALLLATAAAAEAPVAVRPETVAMSSRQLALIPQALKMQIDDGQIPGGIVLVARNGKVVHIEAQGVSAAGSKQPLRPDSVFPLASLSKPVTAVAILMLVEEGKIGLDDPVSKFIPEFGGQRMVRVLKPGSPPPPYSALPGVLPVTSEFGPPQYDMVPAKHVMTVRSLLTHTSGIQIFGIPNDPPPGTPKVANTLATRIPQLALVPLEYDPTTRWAYSNGTGFDVLGRIVEVASGMPFNVFLKQRLFDPLGMKDTDFGPHPDNVDRAAAMFPGAPLPLASTATYYSGAAGLWSTVGDYAHFVQMLLDDGSYGGHRLLKPETVKMMGSNQIGALVMSGYPPMAMPPEGLKFGFGVLTLANNRAAGTQLPNGSFGWDGVGTRRWWAVKDQRVAIVMMAPLIGPAAAPLQRTVEGIVMSSLTDMPPPPPPPPLVAPR